MRYVVLALAVLLPLTSDAGPRSFNVQRLQACLEELSEISSVDPERLSRAYAVQCDDDPQCIEKLAEASREATRIVGEVQPLIQSEIEEAESEGKLRKLVRVSDETYRVCSCARTAGAAQFASCVAGDE